MAEPAANKPIFGAPLRKNALQWWKRACQKQIRCKQMYLVWSFEFCLEEKGKMVDYSYVTAADLCDIRYTFSVTFMPTFVHKIKEGHYYSPV